MLPFIFQSRLNVSGQLILCVKEYKPVRHYSSSKTHPQSTLFCYGDFPRSYIDLDACMISCNRCNIHFRIDNHIPNSLMGIWEPRLEVMVGGLCLGIFLLSLSCRAFSCFSIVFQVIIISQVNYFMAVTSHQSLEHR